MENKTVIVTGGAGYIGSHVCLTLAESGYIPVAYDNLYCGFREFVQWGPFEQGDMLDKARLDEVLRRYRPLGVIHLAGHTEVNKSVRDPGLFYRNNLQGTLTLLEAMVQAEVKNLVFSSTAAVYGEAGLGSIKEDDDISPINPYGRSKLGCEWLIQDFAKAHGIRFICLRYFNAAGADFQSRIGEWHRPETHLIPLVLLSTWETGKPLTVFGTDYPTPDGTCVRDYVHVLDLADAHFLALRQLQGGCGDKALNLGTGKGFSVLEVLQAAQRVTGGKINFEMGPRRPGDPPSLVADPGAAQAHLEWRAQYADLHPIIESAWKWIRNKAPVV